MKNKFSKLSAVCFLIIASAGLGCSSGAYRSEGNVYSPPPEINSESARAEAHRYQISPPPELVASGLVDASGLNSTSPDRESDKNYDTYGYTNTSDYDYRNNYSDTKSENHSFGQSAVLNFDQNASDLNESAKARLRDIVASIGRNNIKRVEVASWSDKDFPKSGPDLSKMDRNLADQRADHIKQFLKDDADLSFMRIKTYSMAETSNWMARMFRTDEAELKSVFSKQAEAPMNREDFNVIMNDGGPQKAVLIFIKK